MARVAGLDLPEQSRVSPTGALRASADDSDHIPPKVHPTGVKAVDVDPSAGEGTEAETAWFALVRMKEGGGLGGGGTEVGMQACPHVRVSACRRVRVSVCLAHGAASPMLRLSACPWISRELGGLLDSVNPLPRPGEILGAHIRRVCPATGKTMPCVGGQIVNETAFCTQHTVPSSLSLSWLCRRRSRISTLKSINGTFSRVCLSASRSCSLTGWGVNTYTCSKWPHCWEAS